MNFIKKLFKNESTVVGLCDLKRRQAVNSFNFAKTYNFSQPFGINIENRSFAYAKF
ncbi:MAG: hypothetical protein LUB59_04725 [Candidatus Gastranaerophilales bacterium]|nr:hypothetical protein [Candidatus Gastranaerophilales bacterium]